MLACSTDADLNYGITLLFICTRIKKSQQSHIIRKKLTNFSQSSTGKEVSLKLGLLHILLQYPRLTLEIFIVNMIHTITKMSSIIFHLCQQLFGQWNEVFELERL